MIVGAWRTWVTSKVEPNGLRHQRRAVEPIGDDQPLHVTQDSRQFPFTRTGQTAFVAIRGQWHDGHDYVNEAYEAGARFFIVRNDAALPDWPEAEIVWSEDPIVSWQELVRCWRDACATPTIAITGSNGKTTVKEWLVQLLLPSCDVYSSPRSYNSQVGVPLALGDLGSQHELAIIEAGISEPGEMPRLQACIGPDFGVLTHLGDAHLDHFESRASLMENKLALFAGCQWVVMPAALNEAKIELEQRGTTVYTWGDSREANLIVNSQVLGNGRFVQAQWKDKSYAWTLPFSDEIAYRNAMTAALTALVWGLNPDQIAPALLEFKDLDHRMQRHRKSDGNWVLSDAYTNDWDALQLAVSDLALIPGGERKALIVGPIPGMRAGDARGLNAIVEGKGIRDIWTVGAEWESAAGQPGWRHFSSTESALQAIEKERDAFEGAHVLVKGPRAEKFERLVNALTQQGHATRLVLDLEALAHNLRSLRNFIRLHAPSGAELLAVIKASGYGTNAPAIARVLQFHRVPLVAVACTEEGVELRKHGISMRILVLNPTPNTLSTLVAYRLEPTIHTFEQYDNLVSTLEQQGHDGAPWPIHLKIDSGMHRLGFSPDELDNLIDLIGRPETEVKTVFSHLASAERPAHDAKTRRQIETFESVVKALRARNPHLQSHILNTAGCLRFPEVTGDFVRIGIGLMGIELVASKGLQLQPVVRFETSISSLHHVPANEGVGYGFEDAAAHPRTLATLPVGYADGFPRNLSNGRGAVTIRGQQARVVGKVCMDMVMVDVSHIPEVTVGDSVEIFGLHQRIEDFAAAAETIPYEILTRIPGRVAREQRGN